MLSAAARSLLVQVVHEGAEIEMRQDDTPDKRVLLAVTRDVAIDDRPDGSVSIRLRPVVIGPDQRLDLPSMTTRVFPVEAGDVIVPEHPVIGLRVRGGRYVAVRPVSQATVEALRTWDAYWVRLSAESRAAAAQLRPGA